MTTKNRPKLQLALDMLDQRQALAILEKTAEYIDIIEVGTPLLKYQGISIVHTIRQQYPDKTLLVDTKTMDVGQYEADFCFAAGADMVSVLGVADDNTIRGAFASARAHSGKVMVDLIGVPRVVERARFLDTLGVDYLGIHSGIDQQQRGKTPLQELREVSASVHTPLSVAGGINPATLPELLRYNPGIVVIGGAITQAQQPGAMAQAVREMLDACTA
jgi:3-hexulose-6-phosphate synthase